MQNGSRGAAIVVGGAVAKGAFAAGALSRLVPRLSRNGTPIRVLVGTSSGALNATLLAAGVRAGREVEAAADLARLWRNRGDLTQVITFDVRAAVMLRGVSGSRRVVRLLREACDRLQAGTAAQDVALRIVVASLVGDGHAPTSFEAVERFESAHFADPVQRERIFDAAAASAAFPAVFKPVALVNRGPCVDGGVVNNTPIKVAIEDHPEIDTVYVINADPDDTSIPEAEAEGLGGPALLFRIVEMLINERLGRDLEEAEAVNRWIETLDRLAAKGQMTADTRDEVITGLYPNRDPRTLRRLEIVHIRPEARLPGNPFSGFLSSRLRETYLAAGEAAAEAALARAAAASVAAIRA